MFVQGGRSVIVVIVVTINATGQSKITNLQVAIGIDQQIRGLQVAVQDIARMNVLEAAQDLIDKILNVIHAELLFGINDPVQIGFHEIRDHVHVVVVFHVRNGGWHHVLNGHNVFVSKVLQQFDFSQDPLGIDFIVKGSGDHFDGNFGVGRVGGLSVLGTNHHTVGAAANDAQKRVASIDRKRVLAGGEGMAGVGLFYCLFFLELLFGVVHQGENLLFAEAFGITSVVVVVVHDHFHPSFTDIGIDVVHFVGRVTNRGRSRRGSGKGVMIIVKVLTASGGHAVVVVLGGLVERGAATAAALTNHGWIGAVMIAGAGRVRRARAHRRSVLLEKMVVRVCLLCRLLPAGVVDACHWMLVVVVVAHVHGHTHPGAACHAGHFLGPLLPRGIQVANAVQSTITVVVVVATSSSTRKVLVAVSATVSITSSRRRSSGCSSLNGEAVSVL